jgi:hypothetical protein
MFRQQRYVYKDYTHDMVFIRVYGRILKAPWKHQQQKDFRSQNISHGPAVIARP